ncbi:MAG TPA: hypothetical protein PL196_10310, partial [Burkholderiaceae bacterium]|nr:hypothetical protein [Burkholderiaceae bacterium]
MSRSTIAETVNDVGDWLWGLIQGNFNEQQTTSQLIVDAVIGMIPVVGDVTAVRDITASVIKMVEEPAARADWKEWANLVIGCFALIPVAGGVIKGVGKLLLKVGKNAAKHKEIFEGILKLINRFGHGDAVAWFKKLNLTGYAGEIRGKLNGVLDRIDAVLVGVQKKFHLIIPDSMLHRMNAVRKGLEDLKARAAKMVPDSIKELQARLELLQKHIHAGEWETIPSSLKSLSREGEARLVTTIKPPSKAFTKANMPHPPTKKGMYQHAKGWPDLRKLPFDAIGSFSGKITARTLKPGTKIRRVIPPGDKTKNAGAYWMHAGDFPKSGEAWRKDCAVLEAWGPNGAYIEYTVPKGGLKVWEGKIASQIDSNPKSKTY